MFMHVVKLCRIVAARWCAAVMLALSSCIYTYTHVHMYVTVVLVSLVLRIGSAHSPDMLTPPHGGPIVLWV